MKTYQCKTCGKISSHKKDVCDSTKKISSFYVCESCSTQSSVPESLCKPTEVTPSYYCGKCGSSGADETKLCDPLKL